MHLRPGENVQDIITDAGAKFPDDRYRVWTLWEGWRGYDVNKYQEALRDAFKPLVQFAVTEHPLLTYMGKQMVQAHPQVEISDSFIM